MFLQLQEFAKATPFEQEELTRATSTMLGFGVSTEKVMENLQMLGDISM